MAQNRLHMNLFALPKSRLLGVLRLFVVNHLELRSHQCISSSFSPMQISDTSQPKVSVITATYNSAETLEDCLLSVARQTYLNKEHLIIDGQSKDNTLAIVKKYQQQYPHIRYISEPDKGVWDAMNKGTDMASDELLYFLGSDDKLKDELVLTNIFAVPGNDSYDIIYGNIEHRNAGTQFNDEFNNKLLARFNIAHQAIFYRKNVLEKIGKFNLRYVAFSDYVTNIQLFGHKTVRSKAILEGLNYLEYTRIIQQVFNSVSFNSSEKRNVINYFHGQLGYTNPITPGNLVKSYFKLAPYDMGALLLFAKQLRWRYL